MKTSESIALATASLFEAEDLPFPTNPLRARKVFVPDRSKRLDVAVVMACALFATIHQQFFSAEFPKHQVIRL